MSDACRWDARHAAAPVGVPTPPDALRGREHLLPTAGRALDVACGRGSVAAWLAARGLRTDAVDVSPVAIAAGRTLAPEVTWHEHDLSAGLPAACDGHYDVVVCQRFRDPALYPQLVAVLATGGLLVVTVLSQVGGPGEVGGVGGPFRAAPGELATAFVDLDVIDHTEGNGEATLLARRSRNA